MTVEELIQEAKDKFTSVENIIMLYNEAEEIRKKGLNEEEARMFYDSYYLDRLYNSYYELTEQEEIE